jgi:hypothetical protein
MPMRCDPQEDEEEDWGLPLEMSPQLEGHNWSLFFRLARKRADYFSDVEDLLRVPDIEQIPTRGSSDFRRAIAAILTQPEGLPSIAEQPTRFSWLIEQPTWPLNAWMPQLRPKSAPTLLLQAPGVQEGQLTSRQGSWLRKVREYALLWRARLLAPGFLPWPQRVQEDAGAESLSSSWQ